MSQWIFLEDLQEAGGVYTPPAEKRGHIMMWAHELLRLTKKEQTNYPMVRWSEPEPDTRTKEHV